MRKLSLVVMLFCLSPICLSPIAQAQSVPCVDEWFVGVLGVLELTEGPIYHTYIPIGRGTDDGICTSLEMEKGCRTYLCDIASPNPIAPCVAAAPTSCYLYRVSTCVYAVPTIKEMQPLAASQCQ